MPLASCKLAFCKPAFSCGNPTMVNITSLTHGVLPGLLSSPVGHFTCNCSYMIVLRPSSSTTFSASLFLPSLEDLVGLGHFRTSSVICAILAVTMIYFSSPIIFADHFGVCSTVYFRRKVLIHMSNVSLAFVYGPLTLRELFCHGSFDA